MSDFLGLSVRPISAVVVASSRLWSTSLASLVDSLPTVHVVAVCRDFVRLRVAVMEHMPELLVVRSPLEGLDDLTGLLELRRMQPELGFVIFLQRDAEIATFISLAATASVAFLTMDSDPSEVASASAAVVRGCVVFSKGITEKVSVSHGFRIHGLLVDKPGCTLTDRERAILSELAKGTPDERIAKSLAISVRTLHSALADARDKLDAVDRTHAVALAISARLIDPIPWQGSSAGFDKPVFEVRTTKG